MREKESNYRFNTENKDYKTNYNYTNNSLMFNKIHGDDPVLLNQVYKMYKKMYIMREEREEQEKIKRVLLVNPKKERTCVKCRTKHVILDMNPVTQGEKTVYYCNQCNEKRLNL